VEHLIHSFLILCVEASQKLNRKKKGSSRDLMKGTPFQPDYVYEVLHKMHSSLTAKVGIIWSFSQFSCTNVFFTCASEP